MKFLYAQTYVPLRPDIFLATDKHMFHYSGTIARVKFSPLRP